MAQKVGRRDFVKSAIFGVLGCFGAGTIAGYLGCALKKTDSPSGSVEDCAEDFCEEHDTESLEAMLDEAEMDACDPEKYEILITLDQPKMYIFNQSSIIKTFDLAVGADMPDRKTPPGDYFIYSKTQNPGWYPPDNIENIEKLRKKYPEGYIIGDDKRNPIRLYWIELREVDNPEKKMDFSFGLHGTNNPNSIGKHISHGCIRMTDEGILYVAKKIPRGTIVRIRKEYPVEALSNLFDCSAYDINKNAVASEPKSQ